MIRRFFLVFCLFVSSVAAEDKKKLNILFLGNSYTARHNLSELVEQAIEEGQPGLEVHVERLTYGGQDMFRHLRYYHSQTIIEQSLISDAEIQKRIEVMHSYLESDGAPDADEWAGYWKEIKRTEPLFSTIHRKISQAIESHQTLLEDNSKTKWDYVVLQSWLDVFPQLDTGYARYAAEMAAVAQGAGAKVVLYITAPANQNAAPVTEPVLPDQAEMELKLAAELAQKINADAVVPVPLAIQQIQSGGTELTFRYQNDGHPNKRCAYLTANLFYAALFQKSSEGLAFDTVTETKLKNDRDPDGGEKTEVFAGEEKALLQRTAYEAVTVFNERLSKPSRSITNGKDLAGWDGQPGSWEVRDGEIWCTGVAPKRNWLIYREEQPVDFVLELEFRWDKGNSGIGVRN